MKRSGGPPSGQIPKKIVKKEKKGRESRAPVEEPPTQVIQTDAAHFRMLVQELTSGMSPASPPTPSLSAQSSPQPTSSSPQLTSNNSPPPVTPKTNQRLRNLAPPPIRPIPSTAAQGFMPVPPRNSPPSCALPRERSTETSVSGITLSPGNNGGGIPQFSMPGMPGSPYPLFSPLLSPLPLLSPRDYFWGGYPESPGSLAMKEMAMVAMTQAMGSRDMRGSPLSRPEGISQPGMMTVPPSHLHHPLHPGCGPMFPAFAAGFALGPHMSAGGTHMTPISPSGFYGEHMFEPYRGPDDMSSP